MIDLLEIENFFSPVECAELLGELRAAAGKAATVKSQEADGIVRNEVRKTTRLAIPPEVSAQILHAMRSHQREFEEHFEVSLDGCETPQFLRYETGDYFVPHQDGNTPLIHDDSRFRKVSIVIFLSEPSEAPRPDSYGGGALVFHGHYMREPDLRVSRTPSPGTLIAFRAETTHEVVPVTHGERYTIVSWFRSGG